MLNVHYGVLICLAKSSCTSSKSPVANSNLHWTTNTKCIISTALFLFYKTKFLTQDGSTPLYIASEKGHSDVVNILIRNGADIDLGRNVWRYNIPYTHTV